MTLRLQRIQPKGIVEIYWTVARVRIEIGSIFKAQRVFTEEAPNGRVVVAGPVEIEIRFRVEFTRGVLERIRQ